MNIKFRITCQECFCSMQLNSERAELDDHRTCPNCHQAMSEGDVSRLNNALLALRLLRDDPLMFYPDVPQDYKGFSIEALHPYSGGSSAPSESEDAEFAQ